MLLDRGLLSQEGTRYVLTGEVADLEVPETLQALVAARLDNLDPGERALLQDAAVIGQSFTRRRWSPSRTGPRRRSTRARRAGRQAGARRTPTTSARPSAASTRSCRRCLRTVALGTLSRRDRKAKHLAVARHLEHAWGEEAGDIAEVLASHYLDAVDGRAGCRGRRGDPGRRRAQTLEEAGKRAMSLALGPEAGVISSMRRSWPGRPEARGRLLREAGKPRPRPAASWRTPSRCSSGRRAYCRRRACAAMRRASRACLSVTLMETGRMDEAGRRLARAYETLDDGSEDEAFVEVASTGRAWHSWRGDASTRCASRMSRCRSPRGCASAGTWSAR